MILPEPNVFYIIAFDNRALREPWVYMNKADALRWCQISRKYRGVGLWRIVAKTEAARIALERIANNGY